MRPVPDLSSLPHKSPFDPSPPSLDPRNTTPATFFLSRGSHVSDQEPSSPSEDSEDQKESTYGVQSLGETFSSELATSSPRGLPANDWQDLPDDLEEPQNSRRKSTLKRYGPDSQGSPMRPSVSDTTSRPLTPLNHDEPSSLPSSPKSISNQSFRPLDDISITDEINTQAVGSADEDERPRTSPHPGPGGASQLIMPSLKMPSRRPFTERGKALGRFKVLLAGASGKLLLSGRMHLPLPALTRLIRLGENIFDQIYRSDLRRYRTC